MTKKETVFIGLMLFSMFFGAGNLIFPPFLGMEAGTSFWLAISGFIVTGVGLPFVVLAAMSLVKGGAQALGSRVHPLFGSVFTVIVYLSIGPFLAIPRNANVAYEMGLKPFVGGSSLNNSVLLLLFSFVFFGLVYMVSLNPSKLVDYMGRWITPTLLLAIVVLCVTAFIHLGEPLHAPAENYQTGAFFKGFIEGYSTMDALAALAFGVVILNIFRQRGVKDNHQLMQYTLKAGFVAGLALTFVYVAVGLVGAKMASQGTFENGTAILSATASSFLGYGGKLLLGAIFSLACFTTCVGLTTACGQFFAQISSKFSYKFFVTAVTIVSFALANLGLNEIITVSVPFLVMAYPLTIVLITLSFFTKAPKIYGSAMMLTGLIALYDGLKAFGLQMKQLQSLMDVLPFSSFGLGWVVPALVGTLMGYIWDKFSRKAIPADYDQKAS